MAKNINLNDLLLLKIEDLKNTKIRLNNKNKDGIRAIDEFIKSDEFYKWNYWNNVPYKEGQLSIGLFFMGNDKWLLGTIGKILSVDSTMQKNQGVAVEYKTQEQYEQYFGRVILRYHNKVQQTFRNAESIINDLVVSEILPDVYSGFDFPGYQNVCLSWDQLQTIVTGHYPSYQNALCNQKAVYIQTDKATGKLYVGSATSNNGMLLKRWKEYITNGHGKNKKLEKLVKEKGFDYIKQNFQYSIIENFNSNIDDKEVLQREAYWKDVLRTRKFGYNDN